METQTLENTEFRTSVPKREKSGERFVFYAGDIITRSSKTKNPAWRQGGIVLNFATLKHNGGYIPRCKITPLQDHFNGEPSGFIDENKKDAYVKTYTVVENGEAREVGRVEVAPGDFRHDGLLRKPIYPADEIGRITGANNGVVEMPVSNRSEMRAINTFLMTGLSSFPKAIIELWNHFEARRAAATSDLEERCATAAIMSCEQYSITQGEVLQAQIKNFNSAKTKGQPYTFGERAELLFEQFQEQRPDRVQQAQAGQMDRLTDTVSKFVEVSIANQSAAPQNAEADRIRQLEEENARLKAAMASATVEPLHNQQIVTARCRATTGSGAPCAKEATANGYCAHPAHQKLAETGE